jgi:hypothetical protein
VVIIFGTWNREVRVGYIVYTLDPMVLKIKEPVVTLDRRF